MRELIARPAPKPLISLGWLYVQPLDLTTAEPFWSSLENSHSQPGRMDNQDRSLACRDRRMLRLQAERVYLTAELTGSSLASQS